MYENLLIESGLTKNESLAYLALLKIGKAKSGKIVKESNISSGKIYETLSKLASKGLVKSVSENGVKHFIANKPASIINFIKEKEQALHNKQKELEKILPHLEKISGEDIDTENVSLIKGFRGVSPSIYDSLEKGNLIKIMGVRSSKNVKFNNFWKSWHKRRIELKKNAQMLFSDKNTDYWKFFKNLKYTEVRETLSFSPSALMIIDDECFIFSYEEDELVCINISSKSISGSFRSFFDGLWSYSGKK
jgi:sugar-specific transcriptional regulator TrmB